MDPYLYPNGTLKNRFGITDTEQLQDLERSLSATRSGSLERHVAFDPGYDTLKAIHAHVFQDVFDWAGEPRSIGLSKQHSTETASPATRFTEPERLDAEAEAIFSQLNAKNNLKGLSREAFAVEAADLYGAINRLHLFREGNGRANRAFMGLLAEEAGHSLDFVGVSAERNIAASIASSHDNPLPLREMFDDISCPRRALALAKAATFLRDNGFDLDDVGFAFTRQGEACKGTLVGIAGDDFILRSDPNVLVGNAGDLPQGKASGDKLRFIARGTPNPEMERPNSFSSQALSKESPREPRRAKPRTR